MRPTDFILTKRRGEAHSREALAAFLSGYQRGGIADYQVAAWLMAVCWRGMTDRETADLTEVMAVSGDVLDLGSLQHTVDKHSTGGVGDKTSLVLAPLLAAFGGTVAKMSGRGLGHTGGTVDKLESIPGFRSTLSEDAFLRQAREVGIAISGQSRDLAPLDGMLYALRDATGTVESLPLIASSIMSKKLAGGAASIVLDVKVGRGAFMKTLEEARELARTMVAIGSHAGRTMRALLSDMEQPLGLGIGNTLEVREAVGCLRGEGPSDLEELVTALAEQVLSASGLQAGPADLLAALHDGRAYDRFLAWITAQGGDVDALDDLELAPGRQRIEAGRGGVVAGLDAFRIGRAVGLLGGGRTKKSDPIDPGVGVQLHAKVGARVQAGTPLMTVYHRSGRGLDEAAALLETAVQIGDRAEKRPLVLETLRLPVGT